MKKIIFFLIDGLADPATAKTPLRTARKPIINSLLPFSFLGKLLPLKKSEWPGIGSSSISQFANLGILGYRLKSLADIKRGPLEALGADLPYQDGWLAVRFNFGTVDKNLKVVDRRAGRQTYGLAEISAGLNQLQSGIPFQLAQTSGHRGVLIFKENLAAGISGSDPFKTGRQVLKIKPTTSNQASIKTAQIVQEFLVSAHQLLIKHPVNQKRKRQGLLPANYLLTREAGNRLPHLPNFFKVHQLNRGLVIAENGVVKGTCKLAGFESIAGPEFQRHGLTRLKTRINTDIRKQFDLIFDSIVENSKKYNLIYAHFKGADEAAHDKNCSQKKKVIELFDQYFGKLTTKLGLQDYVYVITGDHLTNCKTGQHQFGAVPVLIINKKIKSNRPTEFSEIKAKTTIADIWKFIAALN